MSEWQCFVTVYGLYNPFLKCIHMSAMAFLATAATTSVHRARQRVMCGNQRCHVPLALFTISVINTMTHGTIPVHQIDWHQGTVNLVGLYPIVGCHDLTTDVQWKCSGWSWRILSFDCCRFVVICFTTGIALRKRSCTNKCCIKSC